MNIDAIKDYLLHLQNNICHVIEKEEGQAHFQQEQWQHANGGGGFARSIAGEVIEKGGVNFSHVYGDHLPHAATKRYLW